MKRGKREREGETKDRTRKIEAVRETRDGGREKGRKKREEGGAKKKR